MIVCNLGELKPGMMLAKPVYDLHGVLLLNKKIVLSEPNIRMLKSWGAAEVWVEGEREQKNDDLLEAEHDMKEALEKELKEKFSEVLEDRVMVEIMRVANKQLLKRYLKRKAQ